MIFKIAQVKTALFFTRNKIPEGTIHYLELYAEIEPQFQSQFLNIIDLINKHKKEITDEENIDKYFSKIKLVLKHNNYPIVFRFQNSYNISGVKVFKTNGRLQCEIELPRYTGEDIFTTLKRKLLEGCKKVADAFNDKNNDNFEDDGRYELDPLGSYFFKHKQHKPQNEEKNINYNYVNKDEEDINKKYTNKSEEDVVYVQPGTFKIAARKLRDMEPEEADELKEIIDKEYNENAGGALGEKFWNSRSPGWDFMTDKDLGKDKLTGTVYYRTQPDNTLNDEIYKLTGQGGSNRTKLRLLQKMNDEGKPFYSAVTEPIRDLAIRSGLFIAPPVETVKELITYLPAGIVGKFSYMLNSIGEDGAIPYSIQGKTFQKYFIANIHYVKRLAKLVETKRNEIEPDNYQRCLDIVEELVSMFPLPKI